MASPVDLSCSCRIDLTRSSNAIDIGIIYIFRIFQSNATETYFLSLHTAVYLEPSTAWSGHRPLFRMPFFIKAEAQILPSLIFSLVWSHLLTLPSPLHDLKAEFWMLACFFDLPSWLLTLSSIWLEIGFYIAACSYLKVVWELEMFDIGCRLSIWSSGIDPRVMFFVYSPHSFESYHRWRDLRNLLNEAFEMVLLFENWKESRFLLLN